MVNRSNNDSVHQAPDAIEVKRLVETLSGRLSKDEKRTDDER